MTSNTNKAKQYRDTAARYLEDMDHPGAMVIPLIVLTILVAILLRAVASNVAPFVVVMGGELPQASSIPIIGWLYDVLNLLYVATGAFIGWFLVQLAETMWILILMDRKAHRAAIHEARREAEYHEKDATTDRREDRHVRKMRKRAVKLPFFFQAAAGWIALSAFVVEVSVNWNAYPIIKSWGDFFAGLTIGDLSPINWGNVGQQAFNLFSTELLVVAIIVCWQWVGMHRNAE